MTRIKTTAIALSTVGLIALSAGAVAHTTHELAYPTGQTHATDEMIAAYPELF